MSSPRSLPPIFRSLRHRNFQLFFWGQLVSLIGTWMQQVAQSWLIYRLTHSAMLLGVAGFMGQIPSLFISPLGGVVADRIDRRKVIVATQVISMLLAFLLSLLTLTETIRIWEVLTLAACLGVVNAFDIPARQAFVVEMVGKEDLPNAIALNSSMFNGARIAGPAVAGILVSAAGEGWCFFMNGVSYVAVIAGLLAMRFPKKTKVRHESSAWEHLMEGFRYIRGNPTIRTLLILLGLCAIIGMPYTVLMPIFADEVLHGGSSALGILMGMTGTGALVGAMALTIRREHHDLRRWISLGSVGFGLSLVAFGQSRSLILSAIFLIPVGFFMMVQLASANTLIQSIVPDRLRGRVMAVYAMMLLGMGPFGALLAGAVAKPLGAPLTVSISGGICVLISLFLGGSLQHTSEA